MNTLKMHNLKLAGMLLVATVLSSCGEETQSTSTAARPSDTQAVRILSQATFGPTIEDINRIQSIGIGGWYNEQFAKPQTKHMDYVVSALGQNTTGNNINDSAFQQSFWIQAVTGEDQLRQRMTYALSQIFVVSFQNDNLDNQPRGMTSYYDMLASHAFGNFRNLLEDVTKHPMMGIYLSALRNQGSNGTARVPDENYAREVMQLFTIGLKTLNQDGTEPTTPSATYTNADITGLARVFTGLSWGGPDKSSNRFNASLTDTNPAYVDPNRDRIPMQMYPDFHETLSKDFLGVTIPADTDGETSLRIALDTLFNHPNVGPFIGKQLIQRLVKSNPSPDYVSYVAAAFNNNGNGVRGDMRAVIKAIFSYNEAIDPTINTANYTYDPDNAGKVREPIIRLANWMRAFHAHSASGRFLVGNTDSALNSLGQTPLRSPSVFNFFRPDYQPPNGALEAATPAPGLVAPEMQIVDELSVFGYLNYMRRAIPNGTGTNREIKANYAAELALVGSPQILLDRISLLLLQNDMSPELRAKITASMATTNNANYKVYQAIFLTMASPEYITQK